MEDFERFFSHYLESDDYDQSEGLLFSIIRRAFLAGWLAAGGKLPVDPPRP